MKKFDPLDPLGAPVACGPAHLQNTDGVNASAADGREVLATTELAIWEMPPGSRFGLKGEGAGALLEEGGIPLPNEINQAVVADGLTVLRLGSEEFLLDADGAVAAHALSTHRERLVTCLQAHPSCLLLPRETSHIRLRITGACATMLLARVAQVDLRPSSSPPGEVLQTLMAHVVVVLRVCDAGFDIYVEASFADYLADTLKTIAAAL